MRSKVCHAEPVEALVCWSMKWKALRQAQGDTTKGLNIIMNMFNVCQAEPVEALKLGETKALRQAQGDTTKGLNI